MSRGWIYDYLISCPSIILLGEFTYRDTYGYVLLTTSYPRLNIVSRNGEEQILSRIPDYFLGNVVEKICICISRGINCFNNSFLENAVYKTMFYGGYVVYLSRGSEAIPLTIELVNTDKYRFYFKQVDGNKHTRASLETWIVLGMSLRTGFEEYLWSTCREIGVLDKNTCFLETYMGVLAISNKNVELNGYFRITPDNNPLRHVINYEKISEKKL